jgi:hypothetical protein
MPDEVRKFVAMGSSFLDTTKRVDFPNAGIIFPASTKMKTILAGYESYREIIRDE